jgi:HlyD family secretion protein
MRILPNRRVLAAGGAVGVLLAVAFWPRAVVVDLGAVSRGPLVVTVDEEGQTRVRDRFVVSSPVGGRVLRIELEPGDRVRRGAVVGRISPEEPVLLDARTRREAEAAVNTARATLGQARAEEQRAAAALAHAEREMARGRRLHAAGAIPQAERDAQETAAGMAREAAAAAAFAARAAAAELERALARLAPLRPSAGRPAIDVVAPVDGVVLRRLRESESVVPPGEPLLEIGNPLGLELVADLLSSDAVRVRAGARALVEEWGGDAPLAATVRRVEPAGFTKVSALGVEEQRVNVVLDFDDAGACASLGDGYRVDVRIVTWESEAVLKVPTGALFRDRGRWAVYVASGGRARLTPVEIGHLTAQEAEVIGGVDAGAQVIVHPGDLIADGVRIRARET